MEYFIAWAVFLLLCIIAVPVASMLDKRKSRPASPGFDDSQFADDNYEQEGDVEPLEDGDAFGGGDELSAEGFSESAEPVVDDFSAFEEEFN